ncbi:MAG TPA: molybdopterin oxidoreductase [Planctomycetaceae bacterium]|nr:molybdopterin oxidoreductase [Planctomycetaceae bacterium]
MSLLEKQPNTKQYWRSLDELAEKPAFQDWMSREFPTAASELPDGLSRRRWMQLMGASLALGGIAGCRWEAEEFAPFTVRPQNRMPGEKQYFSTMWEHAGYARPLTVTSIDGRPIKIEGNTEHPATEGATNSWDQALVLSMYDPDRTTGLFERSRRKTVSRSWDEFDRMLEQRVAGHREQQGSGLAIIHEASSSPTRQRLLKEFRKRMPEALICELDPARVHTAKAAASTVFGRDVRVQRHFDKARIIACFDADPFQEDVDSAQMIQGWSKSRSPDGAWMNRLYCVESRVSLTGSNADHRLPTRSSDILATLVDLEILITAAEAKPVKRPSEDAPKRDQVLAALADDLVRHRGSSILMAGAHQSADVHTAIHRLNQRLDNFGSTLSLLPVESHESVQVTTLIESVQSGQVTTLVLLDCNPVYGSEHSGAFRKTLQMIPMAIHLGTHRNETARLCHWHVPMSHPLESWQDGRTHDGTITVGQPLIAPLFDGLSPIELLGKMLGLKQQSADLVRGTLVGLDNRFRTEKEWRRVIHDGFVADSASQPLSEIRFTSSLQQGVRTADLSDPGDIEIVITHSEATYDGRFANNGWMQETPNSISKLTWDNAALMSPATARHLLVQHGEIVQIEFSGGSVDVPVFELPGVAANSIQLALGYGRTAAGHVGGLTDEGIGPVGVDVSGLLPVDGSQILTGATVTPTGRMWKLATTQDHFAIDTVGLEAIGQRVGELIRTGTISEYREHPDFAEHSGPHHPPLESLWDERPYDGHKWGMAIDLNKCIGCNACMVACQSENNVPIVGKEQVLGGREMHWIRNDRYFSGDPEDPQVDHQPVTCHHCENAPCEQVCPVAATVHSDEGLNDMVYNRCVGTRYCANNCPYKVRRFNFLDYNKQLEEPEGELLQLMINPEVTVRSRGVMEKCTYCVQRIQDGKIDAKNERRSLSDGDVKTACQEACPASAIVFGDLNDPDSAVAAAHASDRSYGMLSELNTRPRTKYLAKIRNPHPWLEDRSPHARGHNGTHSQTLTEDAHHKDAASALLPIIEGH